MTDTTFGYYNNTPEWVRNTDFGSYEVVSEDPLTVEYTITADAVWSDGVPIDEADMLLQWAAISGNVSDAFSPAAAQAAQTAAPAAAAPALQVYTPEQAAQLLGVSAADVVAELEAGTLKGRKIGANWRIGQPALDEFLRG